MPEDRFHDFTHEELGYLDGVLNLFSNNTEIAVAKICKGNTYFCGVKRIKNENIYEENAESIFEIGSLTKVFTSSVLSRMVDYSLLCIDDFIDEYLSYRLNGNAKITFRELSTHTSGLDALPKGEKWNSFFSDESNPYKSICEQDIEHYLQEELVLGEKGKYQYSNLGAAILGYVLSKINNQPYEELLQKELFLPLGMKSSTTNMNQVSNHIVGGLGVDGKQTSNWEFNIFSPAGAVLSCVHDLALFIKASLDENHSFLQNQMRCHFESPEGIKIGLGWHLFGERQVYHNGGTGGYTSAMLVDSDKNNAIVVLSNISGLHEKRAGMIDELAFNLIEGLSVK